MDLFYATVGLVVFTYPINKLVRFLLGKGNIPPVSKAWLTFVIILMFQITNLSLRYTGEEDILQYIGYSLPTLVIFLVLDIFRKDESTRFFKVIRNRSLRWTIACISFVFIIVFFQPVIYNMTGFNDIYYLVSLCVTLIYLYIFLKKPKINLINEEISLTKSNGSPDPENKVNL